MNYSFVSVAALASRLFCSLAAFAAFALRLFFTFASLPDFAFKPYIKRVSRRGYSRP